MTVTPPKNSDLLLALWNNHIWLQSIRQSLVEGKIHPSKKLSDEIYVTQVDCQALKIGAYVLKDLELENLAHEIEAIKEEQKKNGDR